MGDKYIYKIIEERIDHLKELHKEELRRIRDQLAASEKALVLQAEKYEDKLVLLNNEYKRIDKIVETRVSKEIYAQFEISTNKEITSLREWKAQQTGKTYVFGIVVVILISFIMWAFDFFNK